MLAEFREKTFETYFASELARLTRITYSPDQCDEKLLGFDGAFYVPINWITESIIYLRRRRRDRLDGISIKDLEHLADDVSRRMPPFRFNLFVQYKRPEFITSHHSSEWSAWGDKYYRYAITDHQQVALSNLAGQASGRAATVYASPAFWQADDLWRHVANEAIVANSNIANVDRLVGHGRYTYLEAGFRGKGHSEVADIASISLSEIINSGLGGDPVPLVQHLQKAARIVKEAVAENADSARLFEQTRSALFGAEPQPSDGEASEVGEGGATLSEDLATIVSFSEAFSVTYYAMG